MQPISKSLPLPAEPGAATRPREGGGSFGRALSAYLDSVRQDQAEANGAVTRLALGEADLHQVAIALEKAELSTRLLVQVRNKIVDAYREVMRMSV